MYVDLIKPYNRSVSSWFVTFSETLRGLRDGKKMFLATSWLCAACYVLRSAVSSGSKYLLIVRDWGPVSCLHSVMSHSWPLIGWPPPVLVSGWLHSCALSSCRHWLGHGPGSQACHFTLALNTADAGSGHRRALGSSWHENTRHSSPHRLPLAML